MSLKLLEGGEGPRRRAEEHLGPGSIQKGSIHGQVCNPSTQKGGRGRKTKSSRLTSPPHRFLGQRGLYKVLSQQNSKGKAPICGPMPVIDSLKPGSAGGTGLSPGVAQKQACHLALKTTLGYQPLSPGLAWALVDPELVHTIVCSGQMPSLQQCGCPGLCSVLCWGAKHRLLCSSAQGPGLSDTPPPPVILI